ncbi:50S ribosomal protein L17 [candidate division LCP-89 bacterium B3_LCP]|uniref:Large ribosomal subunit protein bL17 n=1 Tax=candidate division LCP-89 bacterium B3_LCP TaxID=2012998 RepID=A0A532UZM3_UNCL8|nr:MAG: 50S ribosomal protein L17 [candidate division LCP-89 bacterium B3_LCP]
MKHRVAKVHLNRTASHRKALLANMACCLIKEKQIKTTVAKARAVRPFIERMITFARKGDLSSRRHVLKHLRYKPAVKVLFDEIGPFYAERNGGYTRILKLGQRRGDAAPLAILELVDKEALSGDKTKDKKASAKKATKKVKQEKEDKKVETDTEES